jgi:IS5 family transposase
VRITTGTIADATILHAPSSTKNREQRRDSEMHQTKKGNQWCFVSRHEESISMSSAGHNLIVFIECLNIIQAYGPCQSRSQPDIRN